MMDDQPTFGEWLKHRRQELDLTQAELAKLASCTVFALRKIESGERRPSKQLAGLLAKSLEIPTENQAIFIKAARGDVRMERLAVVDSARIPVHTNAPGSSTTHSHLPMQSNPLIGREVELATLGKLLAEPHCRFVTITGPGGVGKTRLAIELANAMRTSFPGGVYFVSLASLNGPEFVVPTIAEVFGLSFSGTGDLEEQLIDRLASRTDQMMFLVLDNLEHLLTQALEQDRENGVAVLVSKLLRNIPNLKILATSRERSNIRDEWVFELHGLPVPGENQADRLENYSAVALFLQRARQNKVDFQMQPGEESWLVKICQLVEGTPLAIELAATWVNLLSLEGIAQQITASLDFLTTRMRDVPERHRSLRAVFAHSWELLSDEERGVLCRMSVFRGCFQHQAAEQVAGANLPLLLALHSKSLLIRRDDGCFDLHALIRQFALEKLQETGYFEETSQNHLAYLLSLALDAQQGLRNAQLADWLSRIEQEHNNIRAALEWSFSPDSPPERVKQGLYLITSIDRYWSARGHIREGIAWLERGLQADPGPSLIRAKALRIAGWLYNHGDDDKTAIALLQESVAISRQLNDITCQANALDTLGDVAWRFGDFASAKDYYAESLELYRKEGDPRKIGLSLASAGRLHVDNGYCEEAEGLLMEGLSLLESASDLRGKAFCLNALGRLALFQGEVRLAAARFREALQLNDELGYMLDISECLHELAVVEAIGGNENSASFLWGAASALQKRIGFSYPVDDPIYLRAPTSWLQSAPLTKEWDRGEKMPLDQAVAFALQSEAT